MTESRVQDRMIPCPFCGCANHLWVNEECEGRWYVKCEACQAQGPECAAKAVAIEHWNGRAMLARADGHTAETKEGGQ